MEASLASGGSARLVSRTGTFAPRTMPAAHPPAKYTSDLYKVFPDTISGTTMPCVWPATGSFSNPFFFIDSSYE